MSESTPKTITPPALAEAVARRLGETGRLGLLTDYDGTVISLRPRPGDGVAGEELVCLFRALGTHPRIDVAVVTGRSLEDLHSVLPLAGDLFLFGGNGGEGEGPGHRAFSIQADPASVRLLRNLARRLNRRPWPDRVWLEEKGLALALHVRDAEPDDVHAAQARFTDEVVRFDTHRRLRVAVGKRALEVLPRDLNKGVALKWLAGKLDPSPDVWLALGDDGPDEAMFQALGENDIGVLVAEEGQPSAAHYRLEDHRKTVTFFERLLDTLPADKSVSPKA